MIRCDISLLIEDAEGKFTTERIGAIVLAAPPAVGHSIDLSNRNLADADGFRESRFVTVEQIFHSPVSDTEAYEPHTGNFLHLYCRE